MMTGVAMTAGIIVARHFHDSLGLRPWLVASCLAWGVASIMYVLFKQREAHYSKSVLCQSIILYLGFFFIEGAFCVHQIDQQEAPTHLVTYQELSPKESAKITSSHIKEQLRQRMLDLHIEEQDLAVVSAMALGDKSLLDAETKKNYSVSGASHILAVSGVHISIIFQFFILLMGGKRHSRVSLVLSLSAIWIYVVFIGLPSSAVRSATMLSLYCFALLSRRSNIPIHSLTFAYVIMLVFNPLCLYDIGFQMSFLAVASILLFCPLLTNLASPRWAFLRWTWQLTCMSLAAQIGTLPIIAYYFDRVSCYSLLTNFIAIPMASGVLYLCALLAVLMSLSHISLLSSIMLFPMQWTAKCLVCITQAGNASFQFISKLPGASIEGLHLGLTHILLLYLIIACVYALWRKLFL